MEIWRNIPEWEGFYQVSNHGRVRSVDRWIFKKNGVKMLSRGKIMAPQRNKKGYNYIMFYKNCFYKRYCVARLVGLAFQDICGEYFDGAEIDHTNTIPYDDRAENLCWTTRIGNMNNLETKKHMSQGNLNNPKLSKWVIKLNTNNEILHFYPSVSQAARENGFYSSGISECCNGIKPTYKGFIWKFAE